MRNPLNKARIPENSEPIQEQDPITNPELQKIMNLVNGINRVEPGTREDLLSDKLEARACQFTDLEALQNNPNIEARIRYKSPATPATIETDGVKDRRKMRKFVEAVRTISGKGDQT